MTHREEMRICRENHKKAMRAMYGIADIEGFMTAARRWEMKLERIAEILCEAMPPIAYRLAKQDQAETEASALRCLSRYCRYHKRFSADFRTNRDPRGYAMKLEVKEYRRGLWRDWGGFGIVAPDFK